MTLALRGLPLLALAILGACSGRSDPTPPRFSTPTGWVAEARQTGGGSGDALSAAALLTAARALPHGATMTASSPGPSADRLAFHALAHLEMMGLAGSGPLLESAALVRRLARDPAAPRDENGNQSNLDETLAAELNRLEGFFGGARDLAGTRSVLFPWSRGTADLAAALPPGARREDAEAWLMVGAGLEIVDLEQVGHAMFARAIAAHSLLGETRGGTVVGMTPEDARLGLALLLQALAADETVLRALFFDGTVLGDVGDPSTYDPGQSPHWLPKQIEVIVDPELPGVAASYVAVDAASELLTTAVMLRAASELAWLAEPTNPLDGMRQVFGGTPFGRGSGIGGGGQEVTWVNDVQPLLIAKCRPCHNTQAPTSGFSVSNYADVARAPYVIPGDHAQSGLWIILSGVWKKPGVQIPKAMMPPGGETNAEQRQMIADWIDGGALKEPTGSIPSPRAGLDLAHVLALNLYGLHASSATPGALEHRIDGFSTSATVLERSGYVDSLATGHALTALAAYLDVDTENAEAKAFLVAAAAWAADNLTTGDGEVYDGFDLASGVPVLKDAERLETYAAMAGGLVAAFGVTGGSGLRLRAIEVGKAMVSRFYHSAEGMFDTTAGSSARRYTPRLLATVLDALNQLAPLAETADLADVREQFLTLLVPRMVFSEFEGLGEVLGDGIVDTDKNGIPEPGEAGGERGLAPVFVGSLQHGQQVVESGEVTWSQHILPLFRETCVGCHVAGASLGNYRVDTPGLVGTPGDSGRSDLIVPGDPEASFLYRKLVDRTPAFGEQMPLQRPPLDARGKELVRRWILEGAKNR